MSLTLAQAQTIIAKTLAHAVAAKMKPLGAVVMDARGVVIAAAISDGSSLGRFDIASAKARACVMFNTGTRGVEKLAKDRPHFSTAQQVPSQGVLCPCPVAYSSRISRVLSWVPLASRATHQTMMKLRRWRALPQQASWANPARADASREPNLLANFRSTQCGCWAYHWRQSTHAPSHG